MLALTDLCLPLLVSLIPKAMSAPHSQSVFKGDLMIHDLYISNPFQADPTSSYNSSLNVIVTDEDYPGERPVHCKVEWKAGVSPPDSTRHQCENSTMRIWFPERTFNGVKNFQLQFAHTVIDTSVGECPQHCYLTKYAAVNLTFPGTARYDCDTEMATCQQTVNTTLKANVYAAVA